VIQELAGQFAFFGMPATLAIGHLDKQLDQEPAVQIDHQVQELVRIALDHLRTFLPAEMGAGTVNRFALIHFLAKLKRQLRIHDGGLAFVTG